MGVKDVLTREKDELVAVRRPYETAAFIIFALLMFQELFYLIRGIVNFFKNGFYNTGNIGMIAQNQGFIRRFIQLDSTKLMIVLIAMLLVLLYYALIWLLVWNYCRKQGLPKWTWTTIVVFGPASILLVPTYLIFALYAFRPYVFRFIRKGVDEYKRYGNNHVFKEELDQDHSEFEV